MNNKFLKDSAFQRIKSAYINGSEENLTPKDKVLVKRLKHLHSLRFDKKYSRHQAVNIHVRESLERFGKKLSITTAYRDHDMMANIFGDMEVSTIAFERALLSQNYWELYQLNRKKGDLVAAAKNLDSYAALFNFNEGDTIDPSKLEAHEYKVSLDRRALKLLQINLANGVVNLNNYGAETDLSFLPDDILKKLENPK